MESNCRLCSISCVITTMNHLFDEQNSSILKKLNSCACFTFPIDVRDGFPSYICYRCTGLLESAYEFKNLCAVANARFVATFRTIYKEEEDCNDSQIEIVKLEDDPADDGDRKKEDLEESRNSNNGFTTSDIFDRLSTNENEETHIKSNQKSSSNSQPNIDSGFKKHRMRRGGSFTCDICSQTFCRTRDLLRHMKNTHSAPVVKVVVEKRTEWICETCGKTFTTKYSLNLHVNGKHVDVVEKKYACKKCNYKCRQARNLITHELTHTGEKPHVCSECGIAFSTHGSLSRHILAIHRKERRHQCNICNKFFATSFRRIEHMSFHTGQYPYQCPLCPKAYRYHNGISKHTKKRHPGIKAPPEASCRKQNT